MDKKELDAFAEDVLDRFRNPFIKHNLADIALNSISKFKVRVLPSLLEFQAKNRKLPTNLTFAFACLIRFYKGIWNGKSLPINDGKDIVDAFNNIWNQSDTNLLVNSVLTNTNFWDEDLSIIPHLSEAITFALNEIETNGIEKGLINFSKVY